MRANLPPDQLSIRVQALGENTGFRTTRLIAQQLSYVLLRCGVKCTLQICAISIPKIT